RRNGTNKKALLKPQKSILGLAFADPSCLTSATFLGDAGKFRVDPFRESSSTIYRQANTQG
ncbi:hypothetical protein OAG64_04410, partial [Akkermansiaceae bacterium]|nr:hypothetical protein [Akkermansiaceae bacterium]